MSISDFISKLSQRQIKVIRTIMIPLVYLFIILDFFYPKNDKLIIFGSNTGEYASGSPKTLYEYIKKNHEEYEVYYYLPFEKSLNFRERVFHILIFLPTFLRARVLASSHPTTDFFPFSWSKRKIFINLWHGTPIKSLFFADKGESEDNLKMISNLNDKTSLFIVSSKLEAALIAECFLIDPRKIYVKGHPRNDLVIRGSAKIRKIHGKINNIDKIILYCPTYRRDAETKFFPFVDLDLDHFNQFLKDNNLIILIRGHIYNQLDEFNNFFSDRIINFNFDVCNDVNSILYDVDILITDYSSIYIDFLMLNRPCIFIPYDLENYEKGRGLLLDDYDFWAPGYKVLTYKEFIFSLKKIINNEDSYMGRRIDIRNQFHYYNDGNSCKRVFELISKKGS